MSKTSVDMAKLFQQELAKRRQEKKEKEQGGGDGDKEKPSSSTPVVVVVEDGLGVRFSSATEVEELRATANVWKRGQGAAYTLNDDHVLTRLATTVSFSRALGCTHAIKLSGVSNFGVETYTHQNSSTLKKINGIPDGALVVGTFRIDEKTGDDFTHSHEAIAKQILGIT